MKYSVNLEVTCYQMVEIEAESIEDAEDKAKMVNIDKPELDINEALPIEIYDDKGKCVWTI